MRIVFKNSNVSQGLRVGSGVPKKKHEPSKLRAMYNVGDITLF
jgi:hypothetical protein